ncbi:MAG: hypothetical protein OEM49_10915 [Myxococcales bacterium]|nr:hypothetical protein [Myxococcales bacterium]MDH5306790.1 hypothetical protein [Myxococcales bacterium]MDH5566417.1 hypothetical protein [Myxococcales bacterium]
MRHPSLIFLCLVQSVFALAAAGALGSERERPNTVAQTVVARGVEFPEALRFPPAVLHGRSASAQPEQPLASRGSARAVEAEREEAPRGLREHFETRESCAMAGPDARLFSSSMRVGSHAESFPGLGLGVWLGQQTYRTLRGSLSVGVEFGAALRLREHVNLTAGYRMLGYGRSDSGALAGGDLDANMNAPFLGLALRY